VQGADILVVIVPLRHCSEERLRLTNLGKFWRRRKAFEGLGKGAVGLERESRRLVELRQRQRRAQFERTCALFAGDGDCRLQIA
jgi:hypothetical protein